MTTTVGVPSVELTLITIGGISVLALAIESPAPNSKRKVVALGLVTSAAVPTRACHTAADALILAVISAK